MEKILEQLIDEGWTPASEPPDDDRMVQIAWDDGSTSDDTFGCFDSVASDPPRKERIWWCMGFYGPYAVVEGGVLAWREKNA